MNKKSDRKVIFTLVGEKQIREVMNRYGITQGELGRAFSPTTYQSKVSAYLTGRLRLTRDNCLRIYEALHSDTAVYFLKSFIDGESKENWDLYLQTGVNTRSTYYRSRELLSTMADLEVKIKEITSNLLGGSSLLPFYRRIDETYINLVNNRDKSHLLLSLDALCTEYESKLPKRDDVVESTDS